MINRPPSMRLLDGSTLSPSPKEGFTPSSSSDAAWNSPSQTVIVFDWDDTLCPSTWISDQHPAITYFRQPPNVPRFTKPLKELEAAVVLLLECAMRLGKVIIITNAKQDWVKMSATNFLPGVLPFLPHMSQVYAREMWNSFENQQINQIAAKRYSRSPVPKITQSRVDTGIKSLKKNKSSAQLAQVGAKIFPNEMPCEDPSYSWKKLAFGVELSDFYSEQTWGNVISIGDANYEREATKVAVECCSPSHKNKKSRTKTVKMLNNPSIEELIKQVKRVTTLLPMMVKEDSDIDIELEPEDLDQTFAA